MEKHTTYIIKNKIANLKSSEIAILESKRYDAEIFQDS